MVRPDSYTITFYAGTEDEAYLPDDSLSRSINLSGVSLYTSFLENSLYFISSDFAFLIIIIIIVQ